MKTILPPTASRSGGSIALLLAMRASHAFGGVIGNLAVTEAHETLAFMDLYIISFDLKPGVADTAFADHVSAYLGALKADGRIAQWRLLRRKLGFGPPGAGEWQVMIETNGLGQLDDAFNHVASRSGPIESMHYEVNRHATNITFSLMRDFPDAQRVRGEEKF